MHIERERRFLVTELAEGFPSASGAIELRQGYLETPETLGTFRVRIIDNDRGVLAIKHGKGVERPEFPAEVSLGFAEEALKLAAHRLKKTRHPIAGWEIDVFHPPLSGIILAEFEFEFGEGPSGLPTWIGKGIEVTNSITNFHLARLATFLRGTGHSARDIVFSRLAKKILKIVITGPPTSGKSELIGEIKKESPLIHCMPEVASIVMGQLGVLPGENYFQKRRFQYALYKIQKIFERTSAEFAEEEGKIALCADRGTMDNPAYLRDEIAEYEELCQTDRRVEYGEYALVILLAAPPRDVYERVKANNPNRRETYEEILALEKKMERVWEGHPNRVRIPNGRSWREKADAAKTTISTFLQEHKNKIAAS